MNLKKLTTLLFAGVTAATPFATNAQNPTILQGNYVSNVFGQANFVLNPNAQTNVANVAVTNATRTRSTTTPLVATTEFNVTVTSANGTAVWATRSFDAGMKNQNCEARFSYRGFQATSKAQIKQGANVIAELTLTPSATDPRIASINFPCGDLSSATTFVITDSATLSGTNEIGGIYVGLATNQANLAQAELVGTWKMTGAPNCTFSLTNTTFNQFNVDSDCNSPVVTGSVIAPQGKRPWIDISNPKPGNYHVIAKGSFFNTQPNVGMYVRLTAAKSAGNDSSSNSRIYGSNSNLIIPVTLSMNTTYTSGTLGFVIDAATANAAYPIQLTNDNTLTELSFEVYRFPSSSELVVTPETQNVWGGVEYTNQNQSLFSGVADPTAFTAYTNSTWNQPTLLKGKAQVSTTNSGNDLGFSIPNLPVGSYKISLSGGINSIAIGASTQASCNFRIRETTLNQEVVKYSHFDSRDSSNINSRDLITAANGVFENTSVATRNFILEANKRYDTSSGNLGVCEVFSANNPGTTSAGNTKISIILTPIDNASNSALYVQGPVKSAGTGAAIPAGYVGETRHGNFSSCPTSGAYANLATITITPGVWQVQATFNIAAPGTLTDFLVFVTANSSQSWRLSSYNDGYFVPQLTVTRFSTQTPMQFVKYDGTTMYLFHNNSWSFPISSATGQLWARAYRSSTSCSSGSTSIQAIRIN